MSIKKEEVKSHIQMPKVVLKQFHNESHHFFYYDVVKKIIGYNGSANSINTELGYYSVNTEHHLRDNIETPIGKVIYAIKQIDFSQDQFSSESTLLDPDITNTVIRFIYSLISRGPNMFKEMQKQSFYGQFMPERDLHDFAAINGAYIGFKNNLLEDYSILSLIVNKTDVPFVLPVSGVYSYSIDGYSCINLPITPQITFCLIHKDYSDELVRNNVIPMFSIDLPEIIRDMNNYAFGTQLEDNWGYVVCPEREELDRLTAIYCQK